MRVTSVAFAALLAALPFASLSAQAQTKPVVMYTAAPTEIVNAIVPAFKAKTGIEVQVVSAGGGELIKRLQAESARPLADAVISVGSDAIDANPQLFTKYEPKDADKITKSLRISQNWIPFSVTIPTVLAVNTRLVPEAETPKTWKDLADPKWKGKIAFAGADKSSSALTQMIQVIHNFGEQEGWAVFEKMMDNFVITGSSTAAPRGAAQGEYAMAITLEDNAQRYIEGGSPLKIVYPKEGISLSSDAMALVANGPNPDAGKALIDFVASQEGQDLIAKKSGRRPIRDDVAAPPGTAAANTLPVNTYPRDWAAAKNKEFMDRYLKLARR